MTPPINSYCRYALEQALDNVHRHYHDCQYGFPIDCDNELFGRLILEINQAGLSWNTILNKQANFRRAYANFDIQTVANFGEQDRERLLNDAGIIRNKLKVNAAIHNAQQIIKLQQEFGSFKAWLESHCPRDLAAWVKLFKQTFKFTGGEITKEFLMSCGYLAGAHSDDCPVYGRVLAAKPHWTMVKCD